MNGLELTMIEWETLLNKPTLTFEYRNYKGNIRARKVEPDSVGYDVNTYHGNGKHLILYAFDIEKQANRSFAIKDINFSVEGFE